jgi:hypothetical protein
MKSNARVVHACFFVLSLLVTPLFATTVQKMELPQLVSASDNVVQGRVESIEARFEDRTIHTYISVVVDDPLKGDRRRRLLIRQLGGKIGAKTVWIAGMPEFKTGDQVIVFLKDRQDGTFDIVGLNQGKYDIVNDYAVSNVSGVTILDPKTGRMSEMPFVDKAPLETFKAKIRELTR